MSGRFEVEDESDILPVKSFKRLRSWDAFLSVLSLIVAITNNKADYYLSTSLHTPEVDTRHYGTHDDVSAVEALRGIGTFNCSLQNQCHISIYLESPY